MPGIATKTNFEKILTRGRVTAAYFSTSGYVENKDWLSIQSNVEENMTKFEPINKEDSGVFMESSDEEQDTETDSGFNQSNTEQEVRQPNEMLSQEHSKYKQETIFKSDDKLSVISERSCETNSQQTVTTFDFDKESVNKYNILRNQNTKQQGQMSSKRKKLSTSSQNNETSKHKSTGKTTTKRRAKLSPNRNVNLDIPQVYHRQNTADLLHRRDEQVPVARPSVNRKISNVRNNMYGHHLRQSTKKLQDDLRQTMRKYSSEKSQLLKQLSSLRHEMGDLKLSNSPSSSFSEVSSHKSSVSQSRYYMAPNLAAHKISKKKKRTQTQETKITTIPESPKKSKEGILKFPSINSTAEPYNRYPKSPPKNIEWDSGRNNAMHNLPPLDPPPGIAAAQDLLHESFKIPKVTDATRNDIARLRKDINRSNSQASKKKVHFAEKHSVNEFSRQRDFHSKDFLQSMDTKSLPPLSTYENQSLDSIKAYSALPPIPGNNGDDPADVMRATQEYKSLYLKMKDPEQRMKTLAEILYSVRLRMIENEHTIKYGITPKHMKNANTLCDFLMSRNHYSSMSMNSMTSDISTDVRSRQGAPNNTAIRSGRKSNSMQLQNYLRKMSKSRRPSEEIRLSRMMGQPEVIESVDQTITN